MHTYHRIAVQAMDEADAKEKALNFAGRQEWSDWQSLPVRDGETVVVNHKANPKEFRDLVEEALVWTQDTIDKVVKDFGDITLKDLLLDPQYDFAGFSGSNTTLTQEQRDTQLKNSLAVFNVGQAFRIKNSEYGAETFFYDAVDLSPNPKYLRDRCVSNPEEQWIVVVDYHF